jgi:hypothetical protein
LWFHESPQLSSTLPGLNDPSASADDMFPLEAHDMIHMIQDLADEGESKFNN